MNQNATPQRRLFTRIPFQARVMLSTFPGKIECDLIDISLKGALVERVTPWNSKPGDPCNLLVELTNGGASIQMAGQVAHVAGNRLGIRCTELDLESATNLRRLVELNLGDEELLNRELGVMMQGTAR